MVGGPRLKHRHHHHHHHRGMEAREVYPGAARPFLPSIQSNPISPTPTATQTNDLETLAPRSIKHTLGKVVMVCRKVQHLRNEARGGRFGSVCVSCCSSVSSPGQARTGPEALPKQGGNRRAIGAKEALQDLTDDTVCTKYLALRVIGFTCTCMP